MNDPIQSNNVCECFETAKHVRSRDLKTTHKRPKEQAHIQTAKRIDNADGKYDQKDKMVHKIIEGSR